MASVLGPTFFHWFVVTFLMVGSSQLHGFRSGTNVLPLVRCYVPYGWLFTVTWLPFWDQRSSIGSLLRSLWLALHSYMASVLGPTFFHWFVVTFFSVARQIIFNILSFSFIIDWCFIIFLRLSYLPPLISCFISSNMFNMSFCSFYGVVFFQCFHCVD